MSLDSKLYPTRGNICGESEILSAEYKLALQLVASRTDVLYTWNYIKNNNMACRELVFCQPRLNVRISIFNHKSFIIH